MQILPKSLNPLKLLPQWVCYKMVWDEKTQKHRKVPYSPVNGKGAAADDPRTWAAYAIAAISIERGDYAGVGFELGAAGIAGIDIDHCIDDNGNISPLAAEIVSALDSYTEYSPSKKGLHIFVYYSDFIGAKNESIGLEVYRPRLRTDEERQKKFEIDQKQPAEKQKYKSAADVGTIEGGRYLTVTGNVYGKEKPIKDATAALKQIIAKYMAEREKPVAKQPQPTSTVGTQKVTESAQTIIQRMFSSANGERIKDLFNGNISAYNNDHSSADLALMNQLAYWTNGNPALMDEIFRQSALYRPKWDEAHGTRTYGEMTIEKALSDFKPYTRPASIAAVKTDMAAGSHEVTPAAPAEARESKTESEPMKETENAVKEEPAAPAAPVDPRPDSVQRYLLENIGTDLKHFQAFKDRKTGYSNIDEITSLYPGLYVIGAISSLGKTTFMHQMGDQIAERGDHVIYFSLEQSRLEMITKGLARETAKLTYTDGFKGAHSAISIRSGEAQDELLKKAIASYYSVVDNMNVVECDFDTTIATIGNKVKDYMNNNPGIKPVVIIDYLQIIRPLDPRQTTKDAVDSHVRALKMLQKENDLVIMVICSLNRQNYLTPVDFESFKESGGIEYTADVVWGLNLSVMHNEIFDKDKEINKKRELIKKAKLEIPRKVELICLKNRYGKSSYSVGFKYYPQFDYFVPENDFDYTETTEQGPF